MGWRRSDGKSFSEPMMVSVLRHSASLYDHVTMNHNTFRCMMTSSNGNIFRVTSPLCGEFTGPDEFPAQMPVTRSFDVFFDLRPNKRLSKQPWGWWFETPSWSLWRQCNGLLVYRHHSFLLLQPKILLSQLYRCALSWVMPEPWCPVLQCKECSVMCDHFKSRILCTVFNALHCWE